jgi:drug/metabolite transporter (DMT)-like permease
MSDPAARPALWMISGAFFFATMGALTHALGPRCDWLTIALLRALFMFATAVIVARASGAELVIWRPRSLWIRSLAGSFSLVCSFYALTRLPVGEVLTLTNTYPLWIVALTWLSLRRTPRTNDVLRVLCGLGGVVLIERPHHSGASIAAAVALLSSFSTAVAMIGLHRLRHVDARAVVAHFAGVASVVAGVWFIARGPEGTSVLRSSTTESGFDPVAGLLLLGVGVTGTIGQIFLTKAYAAGAPARVAVLGLIQVVFGLGFDVLLWQRSITPGSLAGTAMVLAPTAWLVTHARTGALSAVEPDTEMPAATL